MRAGDTGVGGGVGGGRHGNSGMILPGTREPWGSPRQGGDTDMEGAESRGWGDKINRTLGLRDCDRGRESLPQRETLRETEAKPRGTPGAEAPLAGGGGGEGREEQGPSPQLLSL